MISLVGKKTYDFIGWKKQTYDFIGWEKNL